MTDITSQTTHCTSHKAAFRCWLLNGYDRDKEAAVFKGLYFRPREFMRVFVGDQIKCLKSAEHRAVKYRSR